MSRLNRVLVREAEDRDDIAVGEILVRAFVDTYARKMPEVVVTDQRKEELRKVREKRRQASVLVAELDGKLVGTVSIFKPSAAGSEAWLPNVADLRHLAIDPDCHGKGISVHLLDSAESLARTWNVAGISLHVRKGAEGVARLYQSRGFKRDTTGDFEKPGVSLEAYLKRF